MNDENRDYEQVIITTLNNIIPMRKPNKTLILFNLLRKQKNQDVPKIKRLD